MYCNKENINILTALMRLYGVRHVVVCPGSRNAPLVHNFDACPDIVCHPVTDERSAGFVALGLRQQQEGLVAVCVTSGSALLNVLPAAAEATYQHRGIIVISADRPAAWIDQLDGQTLPQTGSLGRFVGKSVSLPEPHDAAERWHCHRLVCEAILDNMIPPYPSVHINVPVSEPLFTFTEESLPEVRVVKPCLWSNPSHRAFISCMIEDTRRPMIVVGQMPDDPSLQRIIRKLKERYVVLCEQLSYDKQTFTDQMLCALSSCDDAKAYQPDVVMFLGGHTVSKRLRHFLRGLGDDVEVIMVTSDRELHDISQHASWIMYGEADKVLNDIFVSIDSEESNATPNRDQQRDFHKRWAALEQAVRQQHDAFVPEYSSMLAVRSLEDAIDASTDSVLYANSMSVRLGMLYADHYCYCNRGLNGIEGSLSVAVGVSLAKAPVKRRGDTTMYWVDNEDSKTYCVIGDLSFFYDENALWQQQLTGNLRIMLLNNQQGAIFRSLKGLEQSPARDQLVSASHDVTAEGICRQFHIEYLQATDEQSLSEGIARLTTIGSDRPVLLEVLTDAQTDASQYKEYYEGILRAKKIIYD